MGGWVSTIWKQNRNVKTSIILNGPLDIHLFLAPLNSFDTGHITGCRQRKAGGPLVLGPAMVKDTDSKGQGHIQQGSRTQTARVKDTDSKGQGHIQQGSRTQTARVKDTDSKGQGHIQQGSRTQTARVKDTDSKGQGHIQQGSRTQTAMVKDTDSIVKDT